MSNQKHLFGSVAGMIFGATGLVVGLWCSWMGFSSQPYTSAELGTYLGTLGLFGGLTFSGAGIAWRLQQKSLAKGKRAELAA